MKTLASLDGGVLVLTEQAGNFTVAVDDSFTVGGGKAAGVVSVQGKGSVTLSAEQMEALVAAYIESKSPASMVPAEEAVAGVVEGLTESL